MNKTTLLFSLAGLGLIAWLVTRRRDADNRTSFATTATAKPPGFFGLGGLQIPQITVKPGSNDAGVYASAIGSTVNSFGKLAREIWAPNTSVANTGGYRTEPISPVPTTATSYDLTSFPAGDEDYARAIANAGANSDLQDYGDSFAF